SRGEPVPLGLARRGGVASVLLLVDETADLAALRADWVAVHELFHLLWPRIERADAWLSEGLATYYQEVLRARHGLISQRDAIQHLVDGLARGARADGGLPLGEESARMRATHSYTRVYWSGAAFAFAA